MKEAMFYELTGEDRLRCDLCRFHCLINNGARGICGVRENQNGTLYSLTYGKLCAEHIDPIEKKPLFHVLPGSKTYSIGMMGCNFHCHHCQNATISQVTGDTIIGGMVSTPQAVVQRAIDNNCPSISYTYTEPTTFYEFAYDTARLAKASGLRNIFVTNGYISKDALMAISPYLDAANIDLKGFSDGFYRDVVHARLSDVLDSIIEYRKLGIWIELTTVVIPGLNDSDTELQGIASFIMTNLGADTPWHITQFHPAYQLTNLARTPISTLQKARDIGLAAGLNYVYVGNVTGEMGESTYCPSCAGLLIKRSGFTIINNWTKNRACPACDEIIPGIGM